MKEELILIGGGGHAESIIDTIRGLEKYKITGILDRSKKAGTEVLGIKIIGSDEDLAGWFNRGIKNAVISVGSIGNPGPRRALYEQCKKIGYEFPNILDKSSILSETLKIGEGNFIGKGVLINCNVTIGNGTIINTGAIVEHGCRIDDFVHIAPGSVLCGNVLVRANSHIGAHSTIIQGVTIGNDTIIGAGSLVLKNISSNKLAYGSPAKEVAYHE
ncbi:acetyltransferase [Lacrimispora sp.]|uniref:acetyltransferase n=1 Tax=Lacrimispora sp. TaxID=2719234 RepID=UPI00285E8847|nr:acetyltransferase [Lacrimispora sp.]MDR7811350.1 acetyltransferase [Lacrimispora sp.]